MKSYVDQFLSASRFHFVACEFLKNTTVDVNIATKSDKITQWIFTNFKSVKIHVF